MKPQSVSLAEVLMVNDQSWQVRMQNAKQVQQNNSATPTWLTHKKALGLSAIHSMPFFMHVEESG